MVGDCSSPSCGEDFHPKNDVNFVPGDLLCRFMDDVESEESKDSSVKERGTRSIPSSCTVMAGGCVGD